MPAESQAEQIVAELKTSLEAISGATYWYPPDEVIRSSFWGDHCLRESVGDPATIYTIVPDVYPFSEETFGDTFATLELDLVLSRFYHQASEDPFDPPTDSRWQVQNRMLHDVITRLRDPDNRKLGGLAHIIRFTLADLGAEETYEETWCHVFLRCEIDYDFTDADP